MDSRRKNRMKPIQRRLAQENLVPMAPKKMTGPLSSILDDTNF